MCLPPRAAFEICTSRRKLSGSYFAPLRLHAFVDFKKNSNKMCLPLRSAFKSCISRRKLSGSYFASRLHAFMDLKNNNKMCLPPRSAFRKLSRQAQAIT